MTKQAFNQVDKVSVKRGLFWFRHDLRLNDQPALNALCSSVDEITFVYVLDDKFLSTSPFGFEQLGQHRFKFLSESLLDLKQQLSELGHSLLVIKGDTIECLVRLIENSAFSHVAFNNHCGFYEVNQVATIKQRLPDVTFLSKDALTLFNEGDFPFSIAEMPDVFSPFRRKVEKFLKPSAPTQTNMEFKAPYTPDIPDDYLFNIEGTLPSALDDGFIGGETAALSHLDTYLFSWKRASTYKETRNALDAWRDSTKLSPWLAHGNISPRQVMQSVHQFEQEIEKNDSTYWIYFELLWREFFHWLQFKYGAKWFQFAGIQQRIPNTCHDENVFASWCNGETGYEIVDACMRQLRETGYMSNRGRQLVASCFVHELRQDWRYGAAWFEHQLIDYDVGSNWGNWLYLAGVGSDPRGHRQFNLQKQTDIYDSNGEFRTKWLSS